MDNQLWGELVADIIQQQEIYHQMLATNESRLDTLRDYLAPHIVAYLEQPRLVLVEFETNIRYETIHNVYQMDDAIWFFANESERRNLLILPGLYDRAYFSGAAYLASFNAAVSVILQESTEFFIAKVMKWKEDSNA